MDSLCHAALHDDLLVTEIICEVASSIEHILSIMVNLFNPQKILTGSPLNKAARILFPSMTDLFANGHYLPAAER